MLHCEDFKNVPVLWGPKSWSLQDKWFILGFVCVCLWEGLLTNQPSLFPLTNRKSPPLLVHTRAETSVAYFETRAHGEIAHTRTSHTQLSEKIIKNWGGKSVV